MNIAKAFLPSVYQAHSDNLTRLAILFDVNNKMMLDDEIIALLNNSDVHLGWFLYHIKDTRNSVAKTLAQSVMDPQYTNVHTLALKLASDLYSERGGASNLTIYDAIIDLDDADANHCISYEDTGVLIQLNKTVTANGMSISAFHNALTLKYKCDAHVLIDLLTSEEKLRNEKVFRPDSQVVAEEEIPEIDLYIHGVIRHTCECHGKPLLTVMSGIVIMSEPKSAVVPFSVPVGSLCVPIQEDGVVGQEVANELLNIIADNSNTEINRDIKYKLTVKLTVVDLL